MPYLNDFVKIPTDGYIETSRGNGSSGPRYIEADLYDPNMLVTMVTKEEDPEAWQLIEEAFEIFDIGDKPIAVAVGIKSESGYQEIWGI